MEVLASSRPIHEAVVLLLRRTEKEHGSARPELDPLRRYSETGQLLNRARRVSAALAGLQRRLERPAASEEALDWRLDGPLGPVAIARKLVAEQSDERNVPGEAGFVLAELALTLSRVDWGSTASIVGIDIVEAKTR